MRTAATLTVSLTDTKVADAAALAAANAADAAASAAASAAADAATGAAAAGHTQLAELQRRLQEAEVHACNPLCHSGLQPHMC